MTSVTADGPVLLKASGAFDQSIPNAPPAYTDVVDPMGGVLDGTMLAGPAGAALAGAVPLAGVMGKSALERLASEPTPDLSSPRSEHAPFRTEADRRKHALDSKRRDLVETRMRPQLPNAPDFSEPRPPSQPRPDPSLGSARGLSPRGLELSGQPPP